MIMCLGVCVCVRARAFVRVSGRVGMCVRACGLGYPTYNSYAPYCGVICGLFGSAVFFDVIS
jgi:hypothetical protein